MDGYWVVRTYEAGAVGEKTKFWVPGERPSSKGGRRERNEIRKQEQNEHSAEKALARLINANFRQGDLLLGLDYSDSGLERLQAWARSQGMPLGTEEERLDTMRSAAEHELRLLLRRVKREMARAGLDLRYIAVTSDMDGDTGESVRVHHHLIVPAEAREAFVEKWVYGRRGLVSPVRPGGLHPRGDLPDPAGAAGAGCKEVHQQPEPGPPPAPGPGSADGGGAASPPRREAAVPGRIQARPPPVHPLRAAGWPQQGSRRSPAKRVRWEEDEQGSGRSFLNRRKRRRADFARTAGSQGITGEKRIGGGSGHAARAWNAMPQTAAEFFDTTPRAWGRRTCARTREDLRKLCKALLLYTFLKMRFEKENPCIPCTARGVGIFSLCENRRFVTRTP